MYELIFIVLMIVGCFTVNPSWFIAAGTFAIASELSIHNKSQK